MVWLVGSLSVAISSPVPLDPPTLAILSIREQKRDQAIGITLSDGSTIEILCREYRREEVRIAAKPSLPSGYLVRCKRENEGQQKLVIWYHGGPWFFADEKLVLEQLAFLEAGYDLFVPFYPGSSDRPFEVEGKRMTPDVVDAVAEAKIIYRWATGSYRIVDVVGESFGAYLASSLSRAVGRKGRALYLINPSLGGENTIQKLYIKVRNRIQINQIGGDPTKSAREMTHLYFGRSKQYDPLREIQTMSSRLKIKLVYGGTDKLIDKKEISRLKAMISLPCGLEYRPENGHEFGHTSQHLQGFRRLLACGELPR